MRDPGEVDWEDLPTPGRYLLHKPVLARAVTLNPKVKPPASWPWMALRIPIGHVASTHVGPMIAETRTLSRGARDIMFIKQLGEEDFGFKMAVPRVWTDASTALQTAKRLRAGSRMRHIDVAALYVQELVYQKQLNVGKVSGTANLPNCPTKHLDAKLKGECFEDLGMVRHQ